MTRETPVRIVASGDVIPLRPLPPDHSLSPAALAAFDHLRAADLAVGSLEAPLTDVGEPWEKVVCYRAHPSRARDVAAMGFGLVSLANNQTMNYGLRGLAQTIEVLAAEGVRHVGAGSTLEEAWAPVVIDVRGLRVAVVACTCVAPLGWGATEDRGGLAALRVRTAYEVDSRWEQEEPGVPPRVRTWLDAAELDQAATAVASASGHADVVVVLVHWGVGATASKADYQRQLAEALVGAGAGLILGGHPPPLQGVDVIGEALVCYSQGTFVRQQPRPAELAAVYEAMPKTGVLLRADVARGGVRRVELLPTRLGGDDLAGLLDADAGSAVVADIESRSQTASAEVESTSGGSLLITLASNNTCFPSSQLLA